VIPAARLLFNDRPTSQQLLCSALACGGVVAVVLGGGAIDPLELSGVALAVLSLLTGSAY
jgi:drug/metabolite transporter (DMT)-like permease